MEDDHTPQKGVVKALAVSGPDTAVEVLSSSKPQKRPCHNRMKFFIPISIAAVAFYIVTVLVLTSHQRSLATGGLDDPAPSSLGIGVGIYDVTGPAADVNMMGYAVLTQVTGGIHLRLRSRAFVVVDPLTTKRFAFVSVDCGMAGQLMKILVLEKLQQVLPNMYTHDNLCISGTHTHSAPAGFLQYVLFQVSSLGYVPEAANAFVDGIVQSVLRAHNNVAYGADVLIAQDLLDNTNINRSPTSYMANPAEERAKYEAVGNSTDHLMVLLKFMNSTGEPLGMVNWFAVHGTSMNNTNRLISGDNKGYASLLFEQDMNPGYLPGEGPFVAAFAQTNLGDVSPNTKGPHCLDTGLPCDLEHSTCNGRTELCVASGPGKDMFESTSIIAKQQHAKARELFANATKSIRGPIDYIHQFVHMPSVVLSGTNTTLCTPAMGYAFAAGTTDGPGMFNFVQGTNSTNPFWNIVSHVLSKPSAATVACQAPKPILLDTGDATFPYEWDPSIVPVQLLRLGSLVIIAVPGEFTTMAGRRLREAVKNTLVENGMFTQDEGTVVIAGLSNTYSSYIATFEEYQRQRYEAASTIYGPHTLEGYIQLFVGLATAMAKGETVPAGPSPPNFSSSMISLLPGVIVDGVAFGTHFGDVVTNAASSYTRGSTVQVVFRSACPRNNLRTGDTFVKVQLLQPNNEWLTVAVDGSWETRFHWYRHSEFSDQSFADITWDIPQDAQPGTYRIVHLGDYKDLLSSKVHPFQGTSSSFVVS